MTGASWAEYAAAMPDMAAAGRGLIHQFGVGLGYLATTRADGGPRVHPVCPHVVGDDLWVFLIRDSPKRRDLERDGRYALHSFSAPDSDDSFYVTGRAEQRNEAAARARVIPGFKSRVEDDEILYRLTIERALLSIYGPRSDEPVAPVHTKWSATSPG